MFKQVHLHIVFQEGYNSGDMIAYLQTLKTLKKHEMVLNTIYHSLCLEDRDSGLV